MRGTKTEREKILVSACLLGERVRYDGQTRLDEDGRWGRWEEEGRLVWVCPEVAGGLAVPRPAAEIVGGTGADVLDGKARVKTAAGMDVTVAFLKGAEVALQTARRARATIAIFKARSPSCGSREIYDGTYQGRLQAGSGVTTALLERAGIVVFSEEELDAVETLLYQREEAE